MQLVAVLREVKYLTLRETENIPASASELYAKNDTLLSYVANLSLTACWYNKIRETVLEVEYPIIEIHLNKIDQQLERAEKTYNWTQSGND